MRSNLFYPYDTCGLLSLYKLCQFFHLYDPVKAGVLPDKAYLCVTKKRLESIVHPFRFCTSTALLVVSLEKNQLEFHIFLLKNHRRFSFLIALLCVISFSKTTFLESIYLFKFINFSWMFLTLWGHTHTYTYIHTKVRFSIWFILYSLHWSKAAMKEYHVLFGSSARLNYGISKLLYYLGR